MSWSDILHQNLKNFTSKVSISLLIDTIRFLGAMTVLLRINYFYRHKVFLTSKIGHYEQLMKNEIYLPVSITFSI